MISYDGGTSVLARAPHGKDGTLRTPDLQE